MGANTSCLLWVGGLSYKDAHRAIDRDLEETAIGQRLTVIGILGAMVSCTHADPSLFFSKPDVPVLRERIKQPVCKEVWETILQRAEEMCTPGSRQYADPGKIDEGGSDRVQIRAHTYGRRLTHWVEALGFAYQITGEERFGRHGAAILLAAARKLPVTDPRVAKGFAGARGDVMRGFAVGLDWLGEALTPEERRLVEDVAAAYVRNLLAEFARDKTWWKPHHNFIGVAVGAAGMLSLKLEATYPEESRRWRTACIDAIRLWLAEGFDEQGAYYEGTTYAQYGLSNALRFADALLRHGGPDLFQCPRLRRVPEFYAHSMLPGEPIFEARNDARYCGLGDPLLLRMAAAYDSGLAKWLWEQAGSGTSPMRIIWHNTVPAQSPTQTGLPLAHRFVGRGLCVFRTGWQIGDLMLAIEAGPYYKVTHNQADKGHVTLYGLGCRWAIDSGYGNTRDPDGLAQTVAHNCVLIDGQGQTLSGAGLGTNGRVLAFENNDRYGYALCDCTEAYNVNSKGTRGVGVQHAYRHALFVRPRGQTPAYAVVLDDIRKDEADHDYTWLLHTDVDMEVTTRGAGATLRPVFTSGDAFVETPADATEKGECAWTFDVIDPGDYAVWARVRAGGAEVGRSDSFFVQFDSGRTVAWHAPCRREWSWRQVTAFKTDEPIRFPLQPGKHTLRFGTREPGAQVDRVVVTCDPDAQPPFSTGVKGFAVEAEGGRISSPMRVVQEKPPSAPPRMEMALHAAAPIRWALDLYNSHPRLKASTQACRPDFAAVLVPLPGEMKEPGIRFETTGNGLLIHIEWPDHTDRILWPNAGTRRPQIQ